MAVAGGIVWRKSLEKWRSLPYVPPVREQIAALPSVEILLRASDEPIAASNELLRAANEGSTIASEELLRAK